MIPVCEPLITAQDREAVMTSLQKGWVSSGPEMEQFEDAWARYCGMEFGVAVSSGTAALQIALRLLNLRPGDEVVMPTFTIISCAQAILSCGGVPVLVDSDPRNWQMDVSQIESSVSRRTKAILAVHTYGHPADMDPILDIAQRHGLWVIEDAAEAHGARYKDRMCGGLGDISVFSFYANKLITTGEGGMVLTRDRKLAQKARSLRNLCFSQRRRFLHESLGYNFRMTNIQATLGLSQMRRIEEIVERKRRIALSYSHRLQEIGGLQLPVEEPWARSVYWVYGIVLDEERGMSAAKLSGRLAESGVETRPFFLGMHEQPVFRKMGLFRGQRFPVAERLAEQGLYLPSGLGISDQEIDQVCDAVKEILG
jgi:perosamine synthetase